MERRLRHIVTRTGAVLATVVIQDRDTADATALVTALAAKRADRVETLLDRSPAD